MRLVPDISNTRGPETKVRTTLCFKAHPKPSCWHMSELPEWQRHRGAIKVDSQFVKRDSVTVLSTTCAPLSDGDKLGDRFGKKGVASMMPGTDVPRGVDEHGECVIFVVRSSTSECDRLTLASKACRRTMLTIVYNPKT